MIMTNLLGCFLSGILLACTLGARALTQNDGTNGHTQSGPRRTCPPLQGQPETSHRSNSKRQSPSKVESQI